MSIAQHFKGFAKKSLDELIHPIQSVKNHWKTEMDRIVYWTTVGDNAQVRSGILAYLDGISKVAVVAGGIAALAMNPVMAAGFAHTFSLEVIGAPATAVAWTGSHFLRKQSTESILEHRINQKMLAWEKAEHTAPHQQSKDDGKAIDLFSKNLSAAMQFSEIMDVSRKFGVMGRVLSEADQVRPVNSLLVSARSFNEKSKISVAVQNIQTKAETAQNKFNAASLLLAEIQDTDLRQKGYQRLIAEVENTAQKCMVIPDRENSGKSLGDQFLAMAERYRKESAEQLKPVVGKPVPIAGQPAAAPRTVAGYRQIVGQDVAGKVESAAQRMAAFNARPEVQKAFADAAMYGIPKDKALSAVLANHPGLALEYVQLHNDIAHVPFKAVNALDIGLVKTDSPEAQRIHAGLQGMRDQGRDWPMSMVLSMTQQILDQWDQRLKQPDTLAAASNQTADMVVANQPEATQGVVPRSRRTVR